jgi:hypothetical protein
VQDDLPTPPHTGAEIEVNTQLCNIDPTTWLAAMREIESEGERTPAQTYLGERLVNVAGVALVPESMVAELLEGMPA